MTSLQVSVAHQCWTLGNMLGLLCCASTETALPTLNAEIWPDFVVGPLAVFNTSICWSFFGCFEVDWWPTVKGWRLWNKPLSAGARQSHQGWQPVTVQRDNLSSGFIACKAWLYPPHTKCRSLKLQLFGGDGGGSFKMAVPSFGAFP